ncbi:MAG TPA: RraA family protein [Candidatus Sulfotelmatobacter sp.]|nr:RraA family protein [Candidatus Sulfotelmatobacter sp.]
MPVQLSREELEGLRRYSSPSIANAIETFNAIPRNQGFMRPEMRSLFPELGPMVGYAVTAMIRADLPPAEGHRVPPQDWWDYVLSVPAPRVLVMQDLDNPRPVGAFWGEVQANVHRALGCVGTISDGGVRDLDEVRRLGFHFFAPHVLVSHAYVHIVKMGLPVVVGGITVRPGDLLHGDQHGVVHIPDALARDVAAAAARVEEGERHIIGCCRSPEFTLEKLKETWKQLRG